MRNIKFRVWDKGEKRFIEGWNPDPQLSHNGTIYCWERNYNKEENKYEADTLDNTRDAKNLLVLQLYSGLKDINDKEIYEGDILEFNGERGFVHFGAGAFFIDGAGPMYDHVKSVTPDILEDWVVIGNIYENIDLLDYKITDELS